MQFTPAAPQPTKYDLPSHSTKTSDRLPPSDRHSSMRIRRLLRLRTCDHKAQTHPGFESVSFGSREARNTCTELFIHNLELYPGKLNLAGHERDIPPPVPV